MRYESSYHGTALSRAHRVADAIEVGSIAVKKYPVTFVEAPFGGYKRSGLCREKGMQAVEHYTQTKDVAVRFDQSNN